MKFRQFALIAVTISALSSGLLASSANAQEPIEATAEPAATETVDHVSLFGLDQPGAVSSSSDVRTSQRSAAEIRQARALYRANQRMARMEYNLWIGHEPLRPRFNTIPMMSTRYARPRVIVPIYVNVR